MRRLLLTIATVLLGNMLDSGLSGLNQLIAAPATAPVFYALDSRCSEAVATCTVAISATGGNGRGSWIQATTSNGTAMAPADYGARSSPIYVSPGHSTTFSFPIVNDKLIEGDEYLFVTITAKQNAQVGRARAAVTIVDDDVAPPPPLPPVQCPDGTTVPAGQTCPTPVPPPPTTVGAPQIIVAKCSDKSVWQTAAWEAYAAAHPGTDPLPSVILGHTYSVVFEPGGQQGGLVPNNFTGPFAVAIEVGSTDSRRGDYEFPTTCFQ